MGANGTEVPACVEGAHRLSQAARGGLVCLQGRSLPKSVLLWVTARASISPELDKPKMKRVDAGTQSNPFTSARGEGEEKQQREFRSEIRKPLPRRDTPAQTLARPSAPGSLLSPPAGEEQWQAAALRSRQAESMSRFPEANLLRALSPTVPIPKESTEGSSTALPAWSRRASPARPGTAQLPRGRPVGCSGCR